MQQLVERRIQENISHFLKGGEVLFIVPPFGSIYDISLGPHNLNTIAKSKGFKSEILYLNIIFADILGLEQYDKIHESPLYWMIGERLFARSAYNLPPLGKNPELCNHEEMSIKGNSNQFKLYYDKQQDFDLEYYLEIEKKCFNLLQEVASVIDSYKYKVIGCTTTAIGQTNFSVALFSELKRQREKTITIIGGSNCDGKMAEGIASLSNDIDYIFSGESEKTFTQFLTDFQNDNLPSEVHDPHRLVVSRNVMDLALRPTRLV